MQTTVLNIVHMCINLIFITTQYGTVYYYSHIKDYKTKAQGGQVNWPTTHRYNSVELRFESKDSGSKVFNDYTGKSP